MTQTILSFMLSHDELAALLNLLQLPTLPGMEEDLVAIYQTDQMRPALLAGQRSLQARGMIDVQPDRVVLDQMMAGMLYACAGPYSMFMIGDIPVSDRLPARALYYVSEHLLVEWLTLPTGVHQLRLLPDFRTLASAMLVRTGVKGEAPAGERRTVPEQWISLYTNAETQSQTGLDALLAAGAPAETAAWLAALVSGLSGSQLVMGLNPNDAVGSDSAFNILHSDSGCWLMQPGANGTVTFSPIDDVAATVAIKDLLHTVMPAMFAEG